MLRAVSRDADGRPTLILGLTEENWRLLSSKVIQLDGADLGVDASVMIFRGRDTRDLKAKLVEWGFADKTLLDVPEPTPTQHRGWEPSGPTGQEEQDRTKDQV